MIGRPPARAGQPHPPRRPRPIIHHAQGLVGKALRERGLRAERQYETRRGGEMDLALLCVLGNLGITLEDTEAERHTFKERRGWRYLSFLETMIKAELPNVVQAIKQEAVHRSCG